MQKKSKTLRTILLLVTLTFVLSGHAAYGDDYEPVKSLVDKYNQAGDENKRIEVIKKLSKTEPKIQEDADNLRKVFLRKDWDEYLFVGSAESIKKIKAPSFDTTLIEILKDEKPFVDKASRKEYSGKSEKEVKYRLHNVEIIILKLGEFKSQNAVPILKEYLAIQGAAYWASQALAKIGDKSASEQIREKAYKGDEINYGGQGLDEAINIVKDLEDKTKKVKWPKIAKQIINIKTPEAKPHLKKLFHHEKDYVRGQSAMVFSNMVTKDDVDDIIQMSQNQDWRIVASAIDAMKRLPEIDFAERLINLLNSSDELVRHHAAKALGYKKISKAVPSLEKSLLDKDMYVRQEAFIALYILTNKKYDFQGRNAMIEKKAEREKQSPTFW